MKPNGGVAQFTAAISRHRGVDVAVGSLAQRPSEHLEFVKLLAHKVARGLVGQPSLSVEFLVCSVYQHFWLDADFRCMADCQGGLDAQAKAFFSTPDTPC